MAIDSESMATVSESMATVSESMASVSESMATKCIVSDLATLNPLVNAMFIHLANSGANIKSQQRGEEEITIKQKCQLLSDMWQSNPVTFLERFHRRMRADDLECFNHLSHEYEVNFYLQEVRKRLDKDKSAVSVKNRRYEALKKLEKEGKFFSDEEMKARDPLMFEQLIGQYQTEEERSTAVDPSDLKFSSILTNFMDEQEIKILYGQEKEKEDEMMEEEDSEEKEEDSNKEEDSEEESEYETEDEDGHSSKKTSKKNKKNSEVKLDSHGYPIYKDWQPTPATEAEKTMMRQEFISYMHQKFVSGNEKDFDYSAVDDNAEYDSIDIRTQDEEERYFDDEDPEDVGSVNEDKMEDETGDGELEEWETYGNDLIEDSNSKTDNETQLPM